jgi:hypothetical protein
MEEGEIRMLASLSAIQADVEALKICVEGMKVDNDLRALNGDSPAWGADAFFDAQQKMEQLAQKMRAEI